MNAKIPLLAGLAALLLMGGKKSPSKKTSTTIPTPKPSDIPNDDDKGDEDNDKPANNSPIETLNTGDRLSIVKDYLKNLPVQTTEPSPYGNYSKWGSAKQLKGEAPFYQDWLTNQIYWHISYVEGKSDIIQGQTGELPWYLGCGNKASLSNKLITLNAFAESKDECAKRIARGQSLWSAIRKYIKNNLKSCPPGAYCGEGFDVDKEQAQIQAPSLLEKQAADITLAVRPKWVDPAIVPEPYNTKSANMTDLQWLTYVAYWTAYRSPSSEWITKGNAPAPVNVKDNKNWTNAWLRINQYIQSKV